MPQLRKIFRHESASGLLMISAVLLALVVANSPLKPIYDTIHHTPIHVRIGPLVLDAPLIEWINEGLMVFFFLVIGLEIKRQLFEGHLSSAKCAVLPAIAAFGGMIVPAAIYLALTQGDVMLSHGWAIPTATDIVLALGIISLMGNRIPDGLRVFLTALAVIDDIGAVLIIGLFYGQDLVLGPLFYALLSATGLVLLNIFGVARPSAYVFFGLVLWLALHATGVQAALSGILIAFAVPMRSSARRGFSPVRATLRRFHPLAVLVIVPIFGFFNAGISINSDAFALLLGPASLGVIGGLVIGKPLGVVVATWLAVRLGAGELPRGVNWSQLQGVGMLAGIGFTMSIFIVAPSFSDPMVRDAAKLAVLVASTISAVLGLWWLSIYSSVSQAERAPVF